MGEKKNRGDYLAIRIDGRYDDVIDKIKKVMPQLNSNKRIVETALDRFLELAVLMRSREDDLFSGISDKSDKLPDKI